MIGFTAREIAAAAAARLVAGAAPSGPERVIVDSRAAGPGALFVGLPGSHVDGGAFAGLALAAGAWGVLTTPAHPPAGTGVWLHAEDPLGALQRLATTWRRELGGEAGRCRVIGVTGSTGKTTTKELIRALLEPHRRTVASRANFNTEIGLPLEVLAAPAGTEVLVLEMGMRGPGQIAELARIAEPDVGVIVSIGPVHVERLGGLEQIAAAKAELIAGLGPGGTAVVPADEPLLQPHRREDVSTVTFGPGGDVVLAAAEAGRLRVEAGGRPIELEVAFTQAHLRRDLLAAVAAVRAIGVTPAGRLAYSPGPGRGERTELPGPLTLIDDSYNANPLSMRAALEDLAATARPGQRRIAVLGDMLELGSDARALHVELGRRASAAGVEVLIAVGAQAAAIAEGFPGELHPAADAGEALARLDGLLAPGDVVLVKGSHGIGLGAVCDAVRGRVSA
jgi:UDP-N-acetylmuramoyl-tripeptide--D-alanyl-D-alanine ligase